MDERSSLLNQLQIEKDDKPAQGGGRTAWWLAAALVVVAGAGAAGWYFYTLPPTIVVSVATAEAAPVDVSTQRGSILDASGYVIPRRQATVSSKITGKVVEVLIEEGQFVERDEVVARLDDTNYRAALVQAEAQLAQARANLNSAQVAFDNAVPIFERNRSQYEQQIISAQEFDNARAAYDAARTGLEVAARAVDVGEAAVAFAERNLDDTVVRAPFAGIVTVKAAQEGEMVSPVSAGGGFTRTGIGTIVDMDSLEVEVDVSENFINRVQPDQPVTVTLNAYTDWHIPPTSSRSSRRQTAPGPPCAFAWVSVRRTRAFSPRWVCAYRSWPMIPTFRSPRKAACARFWCRSTRYSRTARPAWSTCCETTPSNGAP